MVLLVTSLQIKSVSLSYENQYMKEFLVKKYMKEFVLGEKKSNVILKEKK
jgi:hypothetical protein